jgi:hypothetical protein
MSVESAAKFGASTRRRILASRLLGIQALLFHLLEY